MARLIHTTIASLDGSVADVDGNFGWAEPEEVHRFVNDLDRPVGTWLDPAAAPAAQSGD